MTLKIYENDEVPKEHFLRTKSLIGEEAKIIWIQAGTTCGAFSQQIRPRIISLEPKSAVFNILRQNETIFDIGNG